MPLLELFKIDEVVPSRCLIILRPFQKIGVSVTLKDWKVWMAKNVIPFETNSDDRS